MEKELIEKAASGDNQAFEKIVVLYQRRIFGFVNGKVTNFDDAQEIVQETFLKCFIELKNLRVLESFSFWLLRICL